MYWGKRKDNYIALWTKSVKFKKIVNSRRVFIAYKRLRINIYNPLMSK